MAIISRKNRFIYLLNPRTASTATAKALLQATDSGYIPEKNILDDDGKILVPSKHTTLRQLVEHDLMTETELASYFKFVTVRNPFDSIVSSWAKKVKDYAHLLDDPNSWVNRKPGYADGLRRAAGLSFSEWIRQEYEAAAQNGGKASINTPFSLGTDCQLRYESLQDGLTEIRDRIGVGPNFTVPLLNVTKGREHEDYRTYYDDRAVEIVSSVFRDELDRLNYSF